SGDWLWKPGASLAHLTSSGGCHENVHTHQGDSERGTVDRTTRTRDPGFWIGRAHADRSRRGHTPVEHRQSEPAAGGHHDPPSPVQKAPLAGVRPNLLPTAPVVRQALHGAK